MHQVFFLFCALCMLASALAVVLFRNPLYSALSLILNFLGMAILYALLEAHFLAVAQVVVYAGAIMVLVTFVLMLLNHKREEGKSVPLLGWAFAAVVGLSMAALTIERLVGAKFRAEWLPVDGSAESIGKVLFSQYVFPFEVTSLVITVAVLGAVVLGKREG